MARARSKAGSSLLRTTTEPMLTTERRARLRAGVRGHGRGRRHLRDMGGSRSPAGGLARSDGTRHPETARCIRCPLATRLLLAGLALALVAFLFGVAVVPTHVSFGGGSLRCGTVVRPDRSELGAVCDRAAANQLRAALVLTGILTALACIPFLVEWRRPARYPRLWVLTGGFRGAPSCCSQPSSVSSAWRCSTTREERVYRSLRVPTAAGAPSQRCRKAGSGHFAITPPAATHSASSTASRAFVHSTRSSMPKS